jgi:hypothetical protein
MQLSNLPEKRKDLFHRYVTVRAEMVEEITKLNEKYEIFVTSYNKVEYWKDKTMTDIMYTLDNLLAYELWEGHKQGVWNGHEFKGNFTIDGEKYQGTLICKRLSTPTIKLNHRERANYIGHSIWMLDLLETPVTMSFKSSEKYFKKVYGKYQELIRSSTNGKVLFEFENASMKVFNTEGVTCYLTGCDFGELDKSEDTSLIQLTFDMDLMMVIIKEPHKWIIEHKKSPDGI